MTVLGVEIGGTKLQAALGTRDGEILELKSVRANRMRGAAGICEQIEKLIGGVLAANQGDPEAIGVGFGGPVDTAAGTVLVSHQVSGWENFALRDWFEERFGLPCRLENDSNTAGWAEYRLGAGQSCRHMVYMNIGSGIGGALVIDGALHDGQGRGAGEIGHMWVPDFWEGVDRPGKPDKLENLCSAWSIEHHLQQIDSIDRFSAFYEPTGGDPMKMTAPILAEAAAKSAPEAMDILDKIAEMIGMALANIIDLLHPERIVIGGGFAQTGEPLFERLRRVADRRVIGPFRGKYEILPAQLEQNVVVAGALLLAPDRDLSAGGAGRA
jgi:glucokinase